MGASAAVSAVAMRKTLISKSSSSSMMFSISLPFGVSLALVHGFVNNGLERESGAMYADLHGLLAT